jgi:hypothetical protein
MATKHVTLTIPEKVVTYLNQANNKSALVTRLLCTHYKLDLDTFEPLHQPSTKPDKPKLKPGKIPHEQAIKERRGYRDLGDKKARYYFNSKGELFREYDDAEPFDVSPERADDWEFFNKGGDTT